MSTAGKVLTVLVTLFTLVWVLLAAGVTQLNRNGTKKVEELQKQMAKLETDIGAAQIEIRSVGDQAYQLRLKAQNDLAVLQARQTEVEKARSQVVEIASRVKFQLDSVKATVAAAQAGSQQRLAEREAETKAKAEAEAQVEQLKAKNKEMRDELAGLQAKFRESLKANKERVGRMLQTGGGGITRPVSFTR